MLGRETQPIELSHIGNNVEHSTPRDINCHLTKFWDIDHSIEMGRKSWYIFEGHLCYLAIFTISPNTDQASWRFQRKFGNWLGHWNHARLQQYSRYGDGITATHHRILDLLHDDVAGDGVRMFGRYDQVAADRRVSSRFPK